jgi:hypothetical protein
MNSALLARHYDALRPWERLPLLVAAAARADEVERDRLAGSAPKQSFRIPDYWGLLEGLEGLAKLYVLRQLDSAAFFWRLLGSLEPDARYAATRSHEQEKRLWKMIQLEAHRMVVRADGWRLLCAELHLDADFVLQPLPGRETLAPTEPQARLLAFTAEEARTYLGELGARVAAAQKATPSRRAESHLETAADVARAMRTTLEEHLRGWV